MNLTESKTLVFLLLLIALAFLVICIVTLVYALTGVEMPYITELFNLMGLSGGAGTARNVAADHVVPMLQQRQQQQSYGPPPAPGG